MMQKGLSKVGHDTGEQTGPLQAFDTRYDRIYAQYCLWEARRPHETKDLAGQCRPAGRFLRYLREAQIPIEAVGMSEARGYLSFIEETGRQDRQPYASRTIAVLIGGARALCEFLISEGILVSNPFAALKGPRTEKRLPRNLPDEAQMQTLLWHLSAFESASSSFRDVMNRYLVHVVAELQYATGLRIGEVADIEPDDLDTDAGLVEVRSKGGGRRYACLSQRACRILSIYRERIRHLLFTERNWKQGHRLFGYKPQGLSELVNRILREQAPQAGVPLPTSHQFRHSVGYHLVRAGCPVRYIQEILGHKAIGTTEIYTKVDGSVVKRTIDHVHPRRQAHPADTR